MPQNPNSQPPLVQQGPHARRSGTSVAIAYVGAFIRLVLVLVFAAAVCGAAYIAIRGIIYAVQITSQALGV